jgi:hypothetical protein
MGSLSRELADLYGELDGELEAAGGTCVRCGECCEFPRSGHLLYAERIEVLHALATARGLAAVDTAAGRCPFHRHGSCANRAGRLLGCRTFLCGRAGRDVRQELHERYLRRIRTLAAARGVPGGYRPFLEHLAAYSAAGTSLSGLTGEEPQG